MLRAHLNRVCAAFVLLLMTAPAFAGIGNIGASHPHLFRSAVRLGAELTIVAKQHVPILEA